ncbi:unnamed protein product [Somion occarium]|uniref:Uncharacterized protein n=1 Tax=Somion occarium TaxID=3059160 RepID=A0ABP1CUM7_9APHY
MEDQDVNDLERGPQAGPDHPPENVASCAGQLNTPDIPTLVTAPAGRYMIHGYCVSASWIFMYAYHHQLLKLGKRPNDVKAQRDVSRTTNRYDVRTIIVPKKCIYKILHEDTNDTLRSMDIEGRNGFEPCSVIGCRSNEDAAALATAFDPERIHLVYIFDATMVYHCDGKKAP